MVWAMSGKFGMERVVVVPLNRRFCGHRSQFDATRELLWKGRSRGGPGCLSTRLSRSLAATDLLAWCRLEYEPVMRTEAVDLSSRTVTERVNLMFR
jgi:hypothetical protein